MWRVEVPCEAGGEEIAVARFMAYEVAAVDNEMPLMARAWFASCDEAARCSEDLNGTVFEEPEDNWNANWQNAEWKAKAIGERLWLAPPWDPEPAPAGRLRLDMHPGTLFGNGDHPTTQLCLAALERHVFKGCTVVDIGCGSGLLSEAALLLGAGCVVGCDLDARAAREARGIAFQGSVDGLKDNCTDVAIANIQLGILVDLLPEIGRILKPSGVAVLSGILEGQAEELLVEPIRIEPSGGWLCLEVEGRTIRAMIGS
jgi:ribosomal protein L11 methyltransferase